MKIMFDLSNNFIFNLIILKQKFLLKWIFPDVSKTYIKNPKIKN